MKINNPLTKEQLAAGDLIPPGIYDFEVMKAEDTHSKAGNEQIKLQLKVWMADGRERIVFDYLLEALEYKIGHFCESVGLVEKYQSGDLSALDCQGKSGQVKIYTQKDKSGQYGDQSRVADYMSYEKGSQTKKPIDSFDDELLPF